MPYQDDPDAGLGEYQYAPNFPPGVQPINVAPPQNFTPRPGRPPAPIPQQYDTPYGYDSPPVPQSGGYDYYHGVTPEPSRFGGVGGGQASGYIEAPMMYDDAAGAESMYFDQVRESGGSYSDQTGLTTMPGAPAGGGGGLSGLLGRTATNRAFMGGVGGGLGSLAGGLMQLFSGQPQALQDAYKRLQSAYSNIDDPNIQNQLWDSPVFKQIAQYAPELVSQLGESVGDMETMGEGDAGLRAEEDRAFAAISERARRGDPLSQRIQTGEAAAGVGRAIGSAAGAAQDAAARRGMPGQGLGGQNLLQAGADYASSVGKANVLAARGGQQAAEMAAMGAATGIRTGREATKERAMNVRNNFRNAMSNRKLQISMANQKVRQASSDKMQSSAQGLHMANLSNADRRRRENQAQTNQYEMAQQSIQLDRVNREGQLDIAMAREQDNAQRAEAGALSGVLSGVGSLAGQGLGLLTG